MPYTEITITVKRESAYKIAAPANTQVYYNNRKVFGSGASGYFIGGDSNKLIIETTTNQTAVVFITEILRNYYDAYDGQGGVMCYQPAIDKWTSRYSYRPEWFSMVGNRLVTFKAGMPYVHNGSNYNSFYGTTYDSVIDFVHSEGGSQIKSYTNVGVEGSVPSIMHCRTEVPNVQSTDLRSTDFELKEGVNYAPLYRDRLSPNVTGVYDVKLYKGDRIKGEVALFQGVFLAGTSNKILKFVNITFAPSRGHSTQNE
jgi:hypothetical protein